MGGQTRACPSQTSLGNVSSHHLPFFKRGNQGPKKRREVSNTTKGSGRARAATPAVGEGQCMAGRVQECLLTNENMVVGLYIVNLGLLVWRAGGPSGESGG